MEVLEENEGISSRKIHVMTYNEKLEVIQEMENGKKLGNVARDFGISKSTLHYIFKDKERIKNICEFFPERSTHKRMTTLRYPEMEASVLNFVLKSKESGERVTGNILKAVALQTASEMNISPFSASNGWLNSFARRNGISFGGGRSNNQFIDYDPIYYDIVDEAKYKIDGDEELVQWRNWCRLCSSPDTMAEFEPFLYEVLQQFLQINFLETVKICKNCHSSLTNISKLVHKSKVTEKMFEELEEQERRNCLTNDSIFNIRQQFVDIAGNNSDNVTVKLEALEDDDDAIYTENPYFSHDAGMDENSYDNEDSISDVIEDYNETTNFEPFTPKKRKKKTAIKITVDESMFDYTCHLCHENFERMCFLSNHTRKEHNCLPQVACTCGRFLATWDSLMNHKRKHENQGEWICDICGSRKMTKSGLKLHMQYKHLRIKPHHLCTVCGKEFKEASGLKQHERSHLPDDEKLIHECTHCGKRFSQKPTLRAHLRLHTAEKNIICHICSKAFTTQNYLKVHLATHEIENIACNYCDGIFKNKSSLQSHVRKMHKPGTSAFPCDECGKCFPNRNFLKRHMASHSGARNFKCTFAGCEQTYKYEKDLRNHFNIHTNMKKKCLYCDREFIDNSNMRKHVLRNHPVEVAEFEAKFGKRRRLKNLLIENELNQLNSTLNSSNNTSLNNSSLKSESFYNPPVNSSMILPNNASQSNSSMKNESFYNPPISSSMILPITTSQSNTSLKSESFYSTPVNFTINTSLNDSSLHNPAINVSIIPSLSNTSLN